MCTSFCLAPCKTDCQHHTDTMAFGFFPWKILLAENTATKRKKRKRHICALIPAEGRSLLFHQFSTAPSFIREVLALHWVETLPQKMLKYCKRRCQWKKYFGPLWISLWQVLKGTRVDRMINFYCSFEIESASWHTVIPFLNQFKMDLEGAHCLGLPCLVLTECVTPSLNFTSDFLR